MWAKQIYTLCKAQKIKLLYKIEAHWDWKTKQHGIHFLQQALTVPETCRWYYTIQDYIEPIVTALVLTTTPHSLHPLEC